MYGYICPFCGDHLDPGERCECREERVKEEALKEKIFEKTFSVETNGQLCMAF